jgi:hypothetical protein
MLVIKTAAAAALILGGLSAAGGVASADPPAPGPTTPSPAAPGPGAPPPAAPKTTIDADGIYKVGTDIAPGTYASAGPVSNGTCSWKRSSGADATLDNAISHKPQVVAIDPTDATFKTDGCQAWSLTDQAPPAPISNLQAQAMMTMLNTLGGGGFTGFPAPVATQPAPATGPSSGSATGPLPGPGAAPAAGPQPGSATGPLPGPAAPPSA